MRKLLLTCIILVAGIMLFSQVPEWQWAVGAGGTLSDSAQLMATDNLGNQYLTGYFQGTTTIGDTTMTSFGGNDIFIAKLDPSGNWLWVRQAGGTSADIGNGIAVDSAGNVYVTGGFVGTASFGPVTLSHNGIEHLFLSKLDNNGNWLWTVDAQGEDSEAMGIAFDGEDNVYLTGAYRYTVTFGFLPQLTCVGLANVFVAKLDPVGHWIWAVQATGVGWDVGICMAVDSAGYIYLTGRFQDTISFGTIALTSNGGYDAFIAKLDGNGNWLWANSAGGSGGTANDVGCSLVLDSFSNIYVTGAFASTATFGSTTLSSSGSTDIFLTKLDSNGNWLWAIKAGGTADDVAWGVDLDSENNAYVIGQFVSTAAFGFNALTSYGSYDVFIAKEDSNGEWNWLWAMQAGGTGADYGYSVQVDSADNLYAMGVFSYTANFGSLTLTSSGLLDTFIAKLEAEVGNADDTLIPMPVSLSCYPNPFSDNLTISLNRKSPNPVNVTIYNLKGQKLKEWISDGRNDITWDGRDNLQKPVSSGVYTIRLTQGGETVSGRFTLLRK